MKFELGNELFQDTQLAAAEAKNKSPGSSQMLDFVAHES
jgi:hypothetical protein